MVKKISKHKHPNSPPCQVMCFSSCREGHENCWQIRVNILAMIQNDMKAMKQSWSGLEGK